MIKAVIAMSVSDDAIQSHGAVPRLLRFARGDERGS